MQGTNLWASDAEKLDMPTSGALKYLEKSLSTTWKHFFSKNSLFYKLKKHHLNILAIRCHPRKPFRFDKNHSWSFLFRPWLTNCCIVCRWRPADLFKMNMLCSNHSHALSRTSSKSSIYGIDRATTIATFAPLNCGAITQDRAVIIIHLHNGRWRPKYKRTTVAVAAS